MVHKRCYQRILFFFFNDTPTPEIYPLPLHDALPIFLVPLRLPQRLAAGPPGVPGEALHQRGPAVQRVRCGPAQAVRRMSMRDRRWWVVAALAALRSEEHTSELQSQSNLVCRLLLGQK